MKRKEEEKPIPIKRNKWDKRKNKYWGRFYQKATELSTENNRTEYQRNVLDLTMAAKLKKSHFTGFGFDPTE